MRGVVASLVALLLGTTVLALSGASTGANARTVLDVGDSLSVGTAPYLRERLRGYRVAPLHDVGLHAYDAAAIVAERRASLPAVIVVSAGTNDDPRIVSTFRRSVRRVVTAAGRRCVVWPTIVRPEAVGASYDGLNGALARVAARHRNLVLVDWVAIVRRHPSWLSPDGVHVGVEGYRARAAAIAAAVRARCPARTP